MIERLSPSQRVIAWRLCEGRRVNRNEIIGMLWGNDPDGGPLTVDRVIDQLVCRLRRALRAGGVAVKTEYGRGWYVDPEDIDHLRDLLAQEIARREQVLLTYAPAAE